MRHQTQRVFAVFVAAVGILLVIRAAVWITKSYWPFRFGEALDLLVLGLIVIGVGLTMFVRSRKHRPGIVLRGVPELELFPTDEERQAAIDDLAVELPRVQQQQGIRAMFSAIAVGVGTIPLYFFMRAELSRYVPLTLAKLIGWAVVVAILAVIAIRGFRSAAPQLLRKRLLSRGVPVCRKCGYLLRGCPGPNCPECGQSFDEQVRALLARVNDASKGM